ncbi:hypothetical protein SISNIDRAFT_456879 [Sistotremastrum niveocremeum HHB9708]|uniref:Uncharacterized protein n=2 Tax=Sistotremastraceae TaxID=3402574 RepID=A0A164S9Q6_9AGAM|nr:hypothetical protein SISNIDRAFT_456879 [Sistotremastrum niveocremeum HHB9708]KZT34300.1 hypothetical protein SISSUDRAFT_1053026 [Sistotremastrum suecicum HHB10207 ss-3]
MAAVFNIDKAELVSIFVEALLYGIFVVLFIAAVWILLFRRSTDHVNKPMLVAAILMFIFATTHLITNFTRIIDAFIHDRVTPGPIRSLQNQTTVKNLLKSSVLVAQLITGDALVTYRTYLVWHHNIWVALVPALLVIGTVVTGTGVVHGLATIKPTDPVFLAQLASWITAELVLTFCNNIINTGLITYKIWSVDRRASSRVEGQSMRPVIAIVVESGALAAATSMITLITYLAGSNSQYIVLDNMSPITGIAFTLIIVRVGLGLANSGTTSRYNTGGVSGASAMHGRKGTQSTGSYMIPSRSQNRYPLQPLAVHITTEQQHSDSTVDMDRDSEFQDHKSLNKSWSPA